MRAARGKAEDSSKIAAMVREGSESDLRKPKLSAVLNVIQTAAS